MAHGEVYVAQTTPAHLNHFYRSILEANEFPGPAVVIIYAACMPEHGIADDAANRQARLAVDSRAFPLFTYDPRRGPRISDRLSLQGNPAMREDWSTTPAGEPVDFLAFARTEGRFAPHFGAAGRTDPGDPRDQAGPPAKLADPPGAGRHQDAGFLIPNAPIKQARGGFCPARQLRLLTYAAAVQLPSTDSRRAPAAASRPTSKR